MFETRHLKTFQLLARTRSFTETGRQLFLTQSAISHQIHALERVAGQKLFDRGRKGVYLTQPGELLIRYADETLSGLDQAQAALSALHSEGQGQLRIGASGSLTMYLLAPLVKEFKRHSPKQQISVVLGGTEQTAERTIAGDLDVGFGLLPVMRRELEVLELFEDELVALMPSTHPWATRKRIPVGEIPTEQFIVRSKSNLTFHLIEKFFHEEGILMPSFTETGDNEVAKAMAKLGLGVALLAPWVAQEELKRGTLVARRLTEHQIRRTWGLFHVIDRAWPPSHLIFAGLCRNLMPPPNVRF